MKISSSVTLTLLLLCATGFTSAKETIPIYEGLGNYHRAIDTTSKTAQAYFDQGMLLAYAFGRPEAAQSFRACLEADPEAAMCDWGEAWALGPYQNGKMKEPEAVKAYAAIHAAVGHSEETSSVERALIEAMSERYAEDPATADRGALDRAYADAMRSVASRFPGDHDVQALFAESLMVLHPWDLYPDGKPRAETLEAIKALEPVLQEDLGHVGACHLYIHIVEMSGDPGRGEACADILARQVPLASHIQHMPSHIYMRIGRYGDAVRRNQEAYLVDQMAGQGKAVSIYFPHNVRMMWFAAWMDGQSFVALEAARFAERSWSDRAIELPQTLARFGRWDELLETKDRPKKGLQGALWHFGRGLAHLRKGDESSAARDLRKMDRIRKGISPGDEVKIGRNDLIDIVEMARGILAGELAAAAGDLGRAEDELRSAMKVEDALKYAEPEAWCIPTRQVLGAILLEAGEAERAQGLYEEDLLRHPENGWSLFGLAQSLRAQGKIAEAGAVEKRFEQAWARADILLTSSRF